MRLRIPLLCICIVSYLYSIAQPNNNCSNAQSIITLDGTCVSGSDNTGATPDVGPSSCTAGSNNNVWYSFVAQGVSAQINVPNGPGVPEITLAEFNGAACVPANFVEIDCANATTLVVDNVLTIGNTYYVMVAFTNNGSGIFDICIDNPPPASNDACSNAIPLSNIDGVCTQYNNDFPSTDILTPGCFVGSTYNVWFSFVAQGVSLDAHIGPGGPGVAQLAVIDFVTPCNPAGAVVVGCATGTNHIVLDNQLTIGQTYYVVVGFQNSSFSAGTGDFDLCVDNPVPAVNDFCNGAITIPASVLSDPTTCYDVISGIDVNNDFPSTDVGTFSCWNVGDSYNVWYSFVAQGNDVEILVDPVFNNCDPEIALVQFTGNPCDINGAQALDCANGTVLDFNDNLVIGQTYFVAVGFENNCTGDFCMNVFDPVPPPNDLPCNAEVLPTNGNCVSGTTVYANPEGFPLPPACQSAISNTVWYQISMSNPNNVGYTIDLNLANGGPNTTVSIAIYQVTDCNNIANLVFFNCGAPPQAPLEFGPVDETATYYIMIATSEPNETDFSICVDEIPPCFTNDLCSTATVINNVVSDMAFVCVPGCNLFADPETFNNNCGIGDFSTVWFQVNTDGNATLMNINVQSNDFDAPTITLFHLITDCSNLQNVGLTQSNLSCITGSQGEAEALGSNVGSNEVYYIAVSSLNSVGGNFTLCVNTISQASACVTSSNIQVVSRSGGGPLTGPFFPGETVSICMNVNSYTAAGNGCQWFQGMIPIFGNGWDPSSFDANGQPLNATLNGNNIGVAGNGLYGASTWDWFTGIGYHHDNIFFQVGDLDGNGTIEMCNILYDVNCPNLGGITGGCCGPCWANAGDPLPPGWFAYGINGTCPTLGPPPTVDWGDGNTCGGGMGPWHFCFDLITRDYPDCLTDPTTQDLSLGFFTTADGETGSWTGGPSVCALDQPLSLGLPMCCNVLTEDDQVADPLCSGQVFVYSVDAPGVDFWTWTYDDGGGVTGGVDGQGGPGSLIIATLVNSGSTSGTGEYTFLGFAGGACPVYRIVLTVPVFPEIMASFTPLVLCATPTNPYIIGPDIIGGSGNYDYIWAPGGETTPTISVDNPVNGTTYTVTVSDDVGCVGTASITIQVYTTFPVDILSPVIEQCIQNGPINLDVNATSSFPPYMYEWTVPGGGTLNTQSIMSDISGQHLVVVTDDEGCIGKDSVTITLDETPGVTIEAVTGVTAICEGNSTQLSAVGSMGETPYIYDWDTPEGPETGKTILAMTPGTYVVTIEDNNGCSSTATIDILLQPSPVPDLGPNLLVCNFDEIIVVTPTELFSDYQWSTGPASNGISFITVNQVGTYTVTVTNEFGCTGETEINVDLYTVPPFPMPDTFKICAGSTITIDGNDYGGPWDYFIWDECPACQCCSTIGAPGDYGVTAFDDNGCSAFHQFTIANTVTLSPNLQGPTVICAGTPITLTADPGFLTYTWSVPGSSNSISVSAPGTYTVTVTDNVGCTGEESLTVTSGDFVAAITGPLSICSSVQSTLNAGAGFTTYHWNNNAATDTIHVNAGTYSVTVTNSSGCTSAASVTVVETPFVPVITGDNMICQTSETSTLDAGGPYLNYVWSANAGGATSQTVTVTAGTYTVTITDISTCVANASFTVGNHPVPPVAITGLPDFCVGGNTQMTATAGYLNYIWNTSEVTPAITINTAGPYTVTITDANGCTNVATTTVNPPYQETVAITGSFIFCPGDQATLAVPPGYASVTWSTGDVNVDQIQTSFEGQVSVIVVDPGGCTAYDTVTTLSNATLYPKITGDSIICDAGPGVLDAGPGFDLYQWSGALGTGQTASVSSPGIYSVTVSSLSGCTGEDQITVVSHASPSAVVTATASACDKQEPGGPSTIVNFKALVTGGDLTGNWVLVSGPSAVNLSNLNSVNFSGLPAGTYTFSYTTGAALAPCTNKSYNMVVTVNACACPAVSVGLAPDLCNDMGTINLNTLVTGTPGGTWTIISSPPGSNPAFITGNVLNASTADAGTYTLQYVVSGLAAYCTNSVTTTINVMRKPVAGLAAAPLQFCAGENQTVTLSTLLVGADAGGIWTETSQIPSIGGVVGGKWKVIGEAPGIYTFDYTVNGPGPCPDDHVTVQVEVQSNPVADAGSTATLDCNQPTVLIGGNGSSAGVEFSYSWVASNGGVVQNPNQLHATATTSGTYVLTVMNTLTGCSSTDQVIIDQIGTFPSAVNLVVKSPDCAGDPPGSAQVMAVTGGIAPYTYSLNNAAPVSSPVFNNLPAGDYDLLVTDATGCKLRDSFTIQPQVDVNLSIVNFVHDSLVFAFGDTIKLAYLYSGTSDTPDSLVWKFGDSIICINCPVLELPADLSGKITLEAYDVRGCKITKSINFLVVRIRDVYIPNVFSPNGDGINDYFTLFTKADVKEISLMEVFTRWGDLVFRKSHFDPNIPNAGWDGTFRNETLNPGVYVYRIAIVYGDDLKEQLSGDITIVR